MHIEQSEFHDHLLRGLAHKMNNILGLFHGYLALLMDDKTLDLATREGLNRIREGANSASELMDRTRAFTTPTSTVWRQVRPDDFFRTLLPALQIYATRGVQIRLRIDENVPDLWVDVSRLRVALKEIVGNACEASPPNGVVEISIKSRISEPKVKKAKIARPGHWVFISVTDNGKGIPSELTEKVFQPFFSTKDKRNAVGLGLSVALGLTELLGGCLRLQSRPGKTTVRMLLPAYAG